MYVTRPMPDDIPEVTLTASDGQTPINNYLKEPDLAGSASDAMRMLEQGAVKVDGELFEDKPVKFAKVSLQ